MQLKPRWQILNAHVMAVSAGVRTVPLPAGSESRRSFPNRGNIWIIE